MKKSCIIKTLAFATILTIGVGSQSFFAYAANTKFTSTTKTTSKINVKSVEYDYDDNDDSIEIDFANNIQLNSSAKATVKDGSGKSYKTFIEDLDNNEIDLDVAGLKAGKDYTVEITGIKKANASKYGTLAVKFSIPKASTNLVKEVEFDNEDDEVSFDFRNNVTYNNVKVSITNNKGTKTYKTTIIEKDNDELSVRVKGLTEGKTYKYTISGVTEKASGSSKTLTESV